MLSLRRSAVARGPSERKRTSRTFGTYWGRVGERVTGGAGGKAGATVVVVACEPLAGGGFGFEPVVLAQPSRPSITGLTPQTPLPAPSPPPPPPTPPPTPPAPNTL